MRDELLDELDLYPYPDQKGETFQAPVTSSSYDKVLEHIDAELVGDSPLAFGLHPNAEIGFRTELSDKLFDTILSLSLSEDGGGDGATSSQTVAETVLQDVLERFAEKQFDLEGIDASVDEMGPYQVSFRQEAERFNVLLNEIARSLSELDMGFRGELTMSEPMEALEKALFLDKVPATWAKLAWPSLKPLNGWMASMAKRIEQISDWCGNPTDIPTVTWISGLFNPQSFLTAILQVTAQAQQLELDKLSVFTEITKKMDTADVTAPSRDGALMHGLSLEGARWNLTAGILEPSKPREMTAPMPVINARTAAADRTAPNEFSCPCYKTMQRGPTYVFSASLKTKLRPDKWVLGGTCLIMES